MIVLFYVVALVGVLMLLGAWLLFRRQRSVPLPAHSPKRPAAHFVDETAEMPAIVIPGRHATDTAYIPRIETQRVDGAMPVMWTRPPRG